MRSTLLVTTSSLWFIFYWRTLFERRLCSQGNSCWTRVSINCRCLIKFCWWLEAAAMCGDVHQGLHDLCCHARFFPNSCSLLSIDARLLWAELCRNRRSPFRSEWHRASYWFLDWHIPFLRTVRTVAAYLPPFCRSTLKIIFHSIKGIRQHGIFTGRFHSEICKGLLYTIAPEREGAGAEKVCQYSQFGLNGSAWRQDGYTPVASQHPHVFENSNLAQCFKNPLNAKHSPSVSATYTSLGEKAVIVKLLVIAIHYLEPCCVVLIWATKRHLFSYFCRVYLITLC